MEVARGRPIRVIPASLSAALELNNRKKDERMHPLARTSLVATVLMASMGLSYAWAQTTPATTSVGPGRVFCRSATACELDIGTPASLKYKIDPGALAAADKERLTKTCTLKATACIATVTGTQTNGGVKAVSIKFYN
jgi:hypothetical protein